VKGVWEGRSRLLQGGANQFEGKRGTLRAFFAACEKGKFEGNRGKTTTTQKRTVCGHSKSYVSLLEGTGR